MTTQLQMPTLSARQSWLANGLLLLVAFLWGSSYGMAKQALVFVPVLWFLTIRFGLTFAIGLPFIYRSWSGLNLVSKARVLLCGLLLLATINAETFSLLTLDAGLTAALISTCLLITPLLESLVSKERLSARLLYALAISFVGTVLICLQPGFSFTISTGFWLILLAALLRSIMVVSIRHLMRGDVVTPFLLRTVQSGVVFAGTLIASFWLLDEAARQIPTEAEFWWLILYLVGGCTLFAFAATNHALKKTSASQASLLMGLEPVFGILVGAIWLQEDLTFLQWIGGLMMIAATYSVLIKNKN